MSRVPLGVWYFDYYNEDAKKTMHKKINRMLVTEASRMEV